MVDKKYQRAFKEVNEVLLHTDIELIDKIPLNKITGGPCHGKSDSSL